VILRRLQVPKRLIVALICVLSAVRPIDLLAQDPSDPLRAGLDFQDANLAAVFTALARAAGLNVIVAELPARTVTLQVQQAPSREAVIDIMRGLAESHQLSFVESDNLIRIGPPAAAVQDALDTAAAVGATELHVYRLRHARASSLASTLESLFSGGARPADIQISGRGNRNMIPPTPDPQEPEPPIADPGLPAPRQRPAVLDIIPDPATNSLLVRASAADWPVIEAAIQALDLRPLQVLIEVVIAEVRRDRDIEVGISARGSDHETRASGELAGSSTGNLVLDVLQVADLNLDVAISILSASGRVRILSRPAVLAQNNREARILVGSERPFIQVFRSLPTDAAIRDQIVQYRDVGTSLTLIPTINPDGYVNLELLQEVSTATAETQFGAPVISTRVVATHLFIRSGQTAVIGGLVDSQLVTTRTGVPLLKDIPFFGWLFGSTARRSTQSELFLFLTPHVIETDEDLDSLRRRIEDRGEMKDLLSQPILPPVQQPVQPLPDTTRVSRPPR
jgi:type II secretory pathway component GspD/PulD (secretin)